MQTVIVLIVVALAAVYLLLRVYKRLTQPAQADCGCGCGGCARQHECSVFEKDPSE